MRRLTILIMFCLLARPGFSQNLVLINGTVIDGAGSARNRANIRIRAGKIAEIGVFAPAPSEKRIDIRGLVVAPGFWDLEYPAKGFEAGSPKLQQRLLLGVTTAVIGVDGEGAIAVEDFLSPFDENPQPLNLAVLVGHANIRRHIMGDDFSRAATPDEIRRIAEAVEFGLREGALGVASDLRSGPGQYATKQELLAIAGAVARYAGLFMMNLRETSAQSAAASVSEAIEVSREAKAPVRISRLPASLPPEAVLLLDKARDQQVEISANPEFNAAGAAEMLKKSWAGVSSDFQLVLARFVRDQKTVTLESAVRKMSFMSASNVGFKTRGVLRKGNAADLVVFDPAHPDLMKYVLINGIPVVENGATTGVKAGSALR